jgi:glycine cleavage system H protein
VGLTKFASRMLGEVVEFKFHVESGSLVSVGQTIGWIEGFKAVSELYCVAEGSFVRYNPDLDSDITLLDTKPYGEGWLYEVKGRPEKDATDVTGYIAFLDATIDKMTGNRHQEGDDG